MLFSFTVLCLLNLLYYLCDRIVCSIIKPLDYEQKKNIEEEVVFRRHISVAVYLPFSGGSGVKIGVPVGNAHGFRGCYSFYHGLIFNIMSGYTDAYSVIEMITSRTAAIFQGRPDKGVLCYKGDAMWNMVAWLGSSFGVPGTRSVITYGDGGKSLSVVIQLVRDEATAPVVERYKLVYVRVPQREPWMLSYWFGGSPIFPKEFGYVYVSPLDSVDL